MNRHEKRKADVLRRRRARALLKFIPDGFEKTDVDLQGLTALRLAYRAWHTGRLTDKQARAVGCSTGRSG